MYRAARLDARNLRNKQQGRLSNDWGSGEEEDGIMKTTISTLAVGGTMLVLAAAISGQAVSAPVPQVEAQAAMLLAENGSNRLLQYHSQRLDGLQGMEDESERFVQMLERKPTAAGPEFEREDRQPSTQSERQYRSPIQRDRAEYGWH
jgi:hypothetical protein